MDPVGLDVNIVCEQYENVSEFSIASLKNSSSVLIECQNIDGIFTIVQNMKAKNAILYGERTTWIPRKLRQSFKYNEYIQDVGIKMQQH